MRRLGAATKTSVLSATLLLNTMIVAATSQAAQSDRQDATSTLHPHLISNRMLSGPSDKSSDGRSIGDRRAGGYALGVSCVPYARQISGIQVTGNAWQWWHRAAGVYARGDQPEVGSILNFRSIGRMVLGHVAVVRRVVNSREVIVDHSNWLDGGRRGIISRNVAVVDVSEANNWSAVRVELQQHGSFGSIYPTYGFIYNRPDVGFITRNLSRPAPQPNINPVAADLRPAAERPWRTTVEVAESVDAPAHQVSVRSTDQ